MLFAELELAQPILDAVTAAGYETATPVQARAIPEVLAGRDVLVSSQTGSGKTAAFMLPALHKLSTPHAEVGRGPRVLVLTPTRELAMQVTKAAETYGKNLRRIKVMSIVGGMPYPLQNRMLKAGVDIMVATPGRLLDQMNSGRIDFSRLEMLVLDEADRMLDMGFSEDLESIVSQVPSTRQTMLFSATFEHSVIRLANNMLQDPIRIEVDTAQTRHDNIEQRLHYADDMGHKNRLLDHILNDAELKQAIVFTSTKRAADDLANALSDHGHSAAALHGDMKQGARTRTLTALRRGGLRVLVATDVAARGIDVQGITHVINYDLPRQAEDYVHRIGRTGRAGRDGIAISFANVREQFQVKVIERFTAQNIPVHTIEGLEPKQKIESKPARANRGGGFGSGNNTGRGFNDRNGSSGNGYGNKPAFGGGRFDRSNERSGERTFDRPAERTFDKPVYADRASNGASAGFNKSADRNFSKPAERTFADRGERVERTERPAATFNKPAEREFTKPAFSAERTFNKPFNKEFDRATPRSFDKPAGKSFDKPYTKTFAKPFERSERGVSASGAGYAGKNHDGAQNNAKRFDANVPREATNRSGKPSEKFGSGFGSNFVKPANTGFSKASDVKKPSTNTDFSAPPAGYKPKRDWDTHAKVANKKLAA
jgi:superfamily II DNA/RNA helicase